MSLERVDPECRPALEALRAQAGHLNNLPLPERRALVALLERQVAAAAPVPEDVEVSQRAIPGPAGAPDLTVRVYRPSQARGPRPGIYYVHGGGMTVGSLETGHADCLRFCSELGAVVVNVDYRLAPENPHPAPGEDCYAGLVWMVAHAEELGLDPARVALYGASAGGGLAVSTALRARDRQVPKVGFVMAIYPMLDHRNATPSSYAITDLGIWDRSTNAEGWAAYLNGQTPDVYASPSLCEDLTGFPPTYLDVGTEDLFRDEDVAFASALLARGVPVELHVDPGAFHGSELLNPGAAVSRRQLGRRLAALRAALYPQPALRSHLAAQALAQVMGQPEALASLLHPEATWSLPSSLGAPVQVGREAIVDFRRQLDQSVLDGSTVQVEVEEALVEGEKVALRTRLTATTRSGLPYENEHAFFLTLREGQIGSVIEVLDPARAFAQIAPSAGANEQGLVERVSPTHVKVVTSIEIDAPHDVVWAVLTDFATLPEWSSGLQGLEGDFREGGQVKVTFRAFGLEQVFHHELKFFEAGAQFGWSDFSSGLFTDRHIYRVEPLLNGRSRFVQSDEPQGAFVRFLGNLGARQMMGVYQVFNRELKARAERVARGG